MLAAVDLFFLWRRVLMIACTIYAVIRLAQSGWCWYQRLRGRDRRLSMARQYLLIQLLRVSPRRFAWELFEIAALAGAVLTLSALHACV